MPQGIKQEHGVDANGNPAGGTTSSVQGLRIDWQDGPLGGERKVNGAFVEDVISAAIGRLEHYQTTPKATPENDEALKLLRAALLTTHDVLDQEVPVVG